MFDAYCAGHGGRVILGPDSVIAFGNAGDGVMVRWGCACGVSGSAPFDDVMGGGCSTSPPLDPAA